MSKLIYGVGYNSRVPYKASENNIVTKAYRAWYDMLGRCHCPKLQMKNPSYVGCTVHPDWLDFQNFAKWYYSHEYSNMGYDLDKDILHPKNKLYSPETCCFAPRALNILLVDRKRARGKHPQGVYFSKSKGKYRAQMRINGKVKNLGGFNCSNEAHQVYKIAKESYVKEKALEWQDRIANNVFEALMNWRLQ